MLLLFLEIPGETNTLETTASNELVKVSELNSWKTTLKLKVIDRESKKLMDSTVDTHEMFHDTNELSLIMFENISDD